MKFNSIVTKLALVTLVVGFATLAITLAVGVQALHIVFGLNFSSYKTALIIIVFGGVINALVSILINILIIMRHFKAQFYILSTTNILLGVLSSELVKKHGLLGGVSLFASANILQLLLLSVAYVAALLRNKDAIPSTLS